jgi:hypothetical protein
MTTRLTVSSLAAPITIKVNTTFAAPLKANVGGPFVIAPGLTSKNVLATVNLKSIGDIAAANTTLVLPGASTDYTFKTASGAVTISTKAVGTTKAVTIASLDLTKVAIDTPLVKFTDLTAKFQAATTKLQAALVAIDTPAVPTLLKDTGISAIDGITNDGTLNVSAKTVGGIISYSIDGGKTFATGALPEGVYAAGKISVVEKATNGSISKASSNAVAITVDKTAPAAATKVALDTDTGLATDNITSDGTINFTGTLEVGARWEYSVNGGTTFASVAANATSFVVPASATAYAADQIQVRQVDSAGNSSAVTKLATALTVDEAAAVPSIALATDSDTAGDGITNVGTVTVTGLEAGATWQYSIGGDFIDGTGTSFTLPAGFTYDAGQINVRQTDVAGNPSDEGSKYGTNSIDWTIINPTTTISADGNSNAALGNLLFVVNANDYTYTISNFDALDKLQFPAGGSLSLVNNSFNDNAVTLEYVSSDNKVSNIVLTNLSAGTDAKLWSTSYTLLNDALGLNTVTLGSTANATGNSSANSTPSNVAVDGASLTGNALVGNVTFTISAGSSYDYTIDGFASGDKLSFPTGGSLALINDSFKDGNVVVEYVSSANNVVDITLTGLTSTQESALWNSDAGLLNQLFVAGTVV